LPTTRSVGRLVLDPPAVSGTHTDATLTRPQSLRYPLPPLHTHTHLTLVFSSNICLPTTRAMQGNDEDHSGAHGARQSTQVQARYHAREEWQQAAGHQWRRTHRKTGERRMYTPADTLLTGLQTMGIRTCWPRCTLANKPPITAISTRVSLACSACLSRDCSYCCI